MSHNIDQSTGKPAFLSYKEPAWHGLGTIIQEKISASELEEYAPQICFEVGLAPNSHDIPGFGTKVSKNSFFTYRKDTGAILGDKLGGKYVVAQNSEIFEIIDDLEGHHVETAGCLGGGRVCFVSVKYDTPIYVGDDKTEMYALVYNSHDGSKSHEVALTPVRVVCNNTLQCAIGKMTSIVKIRHTKNWQEKSKMAMRVIDMVHKGKVKLEGAYNQMAKTRLQTDNQIKDYFANVFLTGAERKKLKAGEHPLDVISTRKQNTIAKVLEYAHEGPGQDGFSYEPNMWLAYNAVNGYYNHKEYKDEETRFEALTNPNRSHVKVMEKAMRLGLNPSNIEPLGITEFELN